MSRKIQLKKKRQRRANVETLESKLNLSGTYIFDDASVEWAYTFEGDAAAGASDAALDGTWDHDNGSDEWDGTAVGSEDGNPGGVAALTEDDTTFIRVQDTGDPRGILGISDPGSNRKVYLTHSLEQDFDEVPDDVDLDVILEDGITLHFRVRVATGDSGPVDDLHQGDAATPWPEDGLGYHQHNGGKSLIAVKQAGGANIAFGLDRGSAVNEDLFSDEGDNSVDGLILPHLLIENDLSDGSDPTNTPAEGFTAFEESGNVVVADDVTEWQEYWVTIQEGFTEVDGFQDGTHIVRVWSSTADNPGGVQQFGVTGATGSDGDGSYIAIGAGGTPRAGAFDLDFFSWTPGVHSPAIILDAPDELPDVGVAYQGEWDYAYDGSQDANDPVGALDGAWDHTQNDRWDGSGPGEEGTAPGGFKSITDGDVTYLRVQDAGDPRGLGFEDNVSNRKMSLNRDVRGDDINRETFLDDGFTFSFRARLATDGPLDDLTFGGDQEAWPAEGRGSDIDFDGTGFITLAQGPGNAFSFALADPVIGLQDIPEDIRPEIGGLIMNNLVGTEPSNSIDTQEITSEDELNLHPIEDLSDWTEFWITIEADTSGGGTHKVDIYTNGSTEASTYHITISAANRFEEFCICPSFTSGATAVDIDFMAYANGVQAPTVRTDQPDPGSDPLPGDADGNGEVNFLDFLALAQNFGKTDAVFADGDFDGDGNVGFLDFLALANNFGNRAE